MKPGAAADGFCIQCHTRFDRPGTYCSNECRDIRFEKIKGGRLDPYAKMRARRQKRKDG